MNDDDRFWPGAHCAGDLSSETVLVRAMVRGEEAWIGHALPEVAPSELSAEAFGNPVPALVALATRPCAAGSPTSTSATPPCCAASPTSCDRGQVSALAGWSRTTAARPRRARTLTQHAVSTAFVDKAAD